MRLVIFAVALFFCTPGFSTTRSPAAKAEFKRLNPCPANGQHRGPCPGYEVDHVTPLKCSGPDHWTNMQWLTVADHRDKTRREARLCRQASRRTPSP